MTTDPAPVREGDAERARQIAQPWLCVIGPERTHQLEDEIAAALRSAREHADNLQLSVNRLIELGTQWRMERDEAREERDAAAAEARRVAVALLRHPTSDMLNQAADDIQRDIDPLQKRAKILLEGIADQIERALDGLPSSGEEKMTDKPTEIADERFLEIQRARAIITQLTLYREASLTCPTEFTPEMRDRIRELVDPPRDDFDRAVIALLKDYDRLIARALDALPASPEDREQ